jgi:Ger(x)C family germination protein
MKNLLSLLLPLIIFCSTGCAPAYQDINKVLMVTAVLVDADSRGKPIIYFEGFRPLRSASKKEKEDDRAVFVLSGKDGSEILDSLNTVSSEKVDFGHNKVVLFTKRAALHGLISYIDLFARDQGMLLRDYVAIYDGEPKDLFEAKYPGDKFMGLYVYDLLRYSSLKSAKIIEVTLKDFFNSRYDDSSVSVLPLLTVDTHFEKIPAIGGGAVLRDFQLADVLSEREIPYYDLFQDRDEPYLFTVENPSSPGSLISVKASNSTFRTRLFYDGKGIMLTKQISLNLNLTETQSAVSLNREERMLITAAVKKQIETAGDALFKKYQAQSLDIFNITDSFRRKYPKVKIDNPLAIAKIKWELNLSLDETSHYRFFY